METSNFIHLKNVSKDDCRDQHVPAVFGNHLTTLRLYIIQIMSCSLNVSTCIIVNYHEKYFLLQNVSNRLSTSFLIENILLELYWNSHRGDCIKKIKVHAIFIWVFN